MTFSIISKLLVSTAIIALHKKICKCSDEIQGREVSLIISSDFLKNYSSPRWRCQGLVENWDDQFRAQKRSMMFDQKISAEWIRQMSWRTHPTTSPDIMMSKKGVNVIELREPGWTIILQGLLRTKWQIPLHSQSNLSLCKSPWSQFSPLPSVYIQPSTFKVGEEPAKTYGVQK